VEVLDLSIEALKLHLLEFLVISDEDLEDTTLSWRLIDNERNSRCMCRLDDDSNVKNMVKHVTRVAAGFVEIFAVSPERHRVASSDEDEEAIVIEEIAYDINMRYCCEYLNMATNNAFLLIVKNPTI
jgi:hypothetical protein